MNESQLLEGLGNHPEWPHALDITDRFNAQQRIDFVARLATCARSIAEHIEEDAEEHDSFSIGAEDFRNGGDIA